MHSTDFVTIGTIVTPHGVRGDVRIIPQTDFPERFFEMETCYIGGELYHITNARSHKKFIILTFAEVKDRNAAELIVRKDIEVTRDELVELPEGQYYIFDMIGLTVVDTEGQILGTLKEVLQPGANDVYVVEQEGQQDLLLPNIESVVLDIDMENKKITVNPPEWI